MINTLAHRNRFLIFVFLISLSIIEMAVSSLLLEKFSGMGWSATFAEDSEGYLLVTRYFSGEQIPDTVALFRYRLFSPLIPYVVSYVGKVLPVSSAFFLVNSLLWIGAAFLFYLFSRELLQSDDRALACSIIFTASLPLMVWGLPIMVDMGAYFFIALILLLSRRFKTYKNAAVTGLITGLAILTKPTLISVLLFLILYQVSIRAGGRALLIAGVSVMLVIIVYYSLGLEFKDFLSYSTPRHQGIFYVLNSCFFCFHLGLILVVWGWKELKKNSRFYVLFIVSVLLFYLPFVHNPRLLFILYPAVIPLICAGADTLSQGLSERFHRDKKSVFRLIIFLLVVVSNLLTVIYLSVTRTFALRSIEDLLKILQVL
jgi:4-amino-4-deoxy-L-arabinose transferase-like glycosyltransferase